VAADASAVLLGLTGLDSLGGIASVSRCVVRALEAAVPRVDRVILLDDPKAPPLPPQHGVQRLAGSSQARFLLQLWWTWLAGRHRVVLFDQLGLARSARPLPLPIPRPGRYAIFCHGIELERAEDDPARAQALRDAWRLLANSERTASYLRATFPEVADRVRVVPLCIEPALVDAWEQQAPVEPPRRERAALIIGRVWAEERGKGHDELLEAWPRVRAALGDAELWVVGDGDDRGRLEAKAVSLGLGDSVSFLGRISDQEVADRYRRAQIFAMPSRQEGFGLVYAEAMWHGTPCLGSTADAASEVVTDGQTGRLVPYGDVDAIAATLCEMLEIGRAHV
jgi:phosphatidylinositol alpha-1,6-mannosyltransferase